VNYGCIAFLINTRFRTLAQCCADSRLNLGDRGWWRWWCFNLSRKFVRPCFLGEIIFLPVSRFTEDAPYYCGLFLTPSWPLIKLEDRMFSDSPNTDLWLARHIFMQVFRSADKLPGVSW